MRLLHINWTFQITRNAWSPEYLCSKTVEHMAVCISGSGLRAWFWGFWSVLVITGLLRAFRQGANLSGLDLSYETISPMYSLKFMASICFLRDSHSHTKGELLTCVATAHKFNPNPLDEDVRTEDSAQNPLRSKWTSIPVDKQLCKVTKRCPAVSGLPSVLPLMIVGSPTWSPNV